MGRFRSSQVNNDANCALTRSAGPTVGEMRPRAPLPAGLLIRPGSLAVGVGACSVGGTTVIRDVPGLVRTLHYHGLQRQGSRLRCATFTDPLAGVLDDVGTLTDSVTAEQQAQQAAAPASRLRLR
jgi:hypothetical protein